MKKVIILLLFLIIASVNTIAKPNIVFEPPTASFGNLDVSSPLQTIKMTIINRENETYKVEEYEISPNPNFALSSDLPKKFVLKPLSEIQFNLFLDPSKVEPGQLAARMIFFIVDSADEIGFNINAFIKENVSPLLRVELYIPENNVAVGKDFVLPVIIKSIEYINVKIDVAGGILKYNSTILAPVPSNNNDVIAYGIRTTPLKTNIDGNLESGDTLFSIAMTTALGDAVSSEVILDNVTFYYENREIEAEIDITNGRVTLDNILYQDGIPRLISRISANFYIFPPPNPVANDFYLKIIYIGSPQLKIYTIDGILLKDLSAELPEKTEKGSEEILIPRNIFTNYGAYIIRLSGRDEFVSKMIIVR